MAQNRVGGGDVEEEVRQHEADQLVFAFEFLRLAAQRDGDVALLGAIVLLAIVHLWRRATVL